MTLYQTKKFKELQAVWYEKLEQTGFIDAEDTTSPNEYMEVWHSSYFQKKYTPDTYLAKQQYYRLAAHFCISYQFKDQVEEKIWRLHSEGLALRKIASQLQLKVGFVYNTVKMLIKKMHWYRRMQWL